MTTASRKTSTPDTPRTARLNAAFALLLGLATACGAGAAEPPHTAQPGLSSCIPAVSTTASASGRVVPFFASTSHVPGRQGFVRVVNRSAEAGTVSIAAFDDHGGSYGPLTLSLDANAAAHFNANDLERGNPAKGLSGCTGARRGDWRLELASQLDIAVFSYNRTGDGFVAPVTGAVPWGDGGFRIATFNPGSNQDQQSLLRLVNFADTDATVTIDGTDDAGTPGRGPVTVHVPAGGARTYSASDLESGGAPGESVWIKAGASAVEPVPVLKGSILRMNIDIGNQSAGGEHAVVLGDIANSRPCGQPRRWERKAFPSRSLPAPLVAPTDGRAWLLFGSDSGFEGRTEIYFTRVSITLTPARAPTRPRFAGLGSGLRARRPPILRPRHARFAAPACAAAVRLPKRRLLITN